MMKTLHNRSRRRIIEVFVDGGKRGRELINRLFKLRLRECIVHVHEVDDFDNVEGSGRPGQIFVDGRELSPDARGRVSTDVLEVAIAGGDSPK